MINFLNYILEKLNIISVHKIFLSLVYNYQDMKVQSVGIIEPQLYSLVFFTGLLFAGS